MNSAGRLHALQIGMMAAPALGGGLDRYYFNLMRALPDVGIDTYGLVVGSDGVTDSTQTRNFARHGASMLERWRGLRAKLPALMAQSDLIVSHFAPYAFPILDLAAKRPFVNHFHGPWALEGRAEGKHPIKVVVRHHIERIVYARGGHIIVLSKAFADILMSQYAVPYEKMSVISGGVDLDFFSVASSRRESRRRLGWSERRPIIVTVRRLVHTKGLENMIAAAATVVRDVPDVLVKIVGTGPLSESLRAMIEERGLARNVQLVGRVAEELLPSVYRAANFVVVPSSALEGFGLIVAEALACGTPVLVTPVGGLPEVVWDLDPALVFEGVTPEMLAHGMTGALTGAITLPDSDRCRTYAERFDWRLVASRVAAVYRDVAAAPH